MVKMKRLLTILLALILLVGGITGCRASNENQSSNNAPEVNNVEENNNEVNEEVIHVTISKDEEAEVLTEKDIEVKEGDILMDVLKEHFDIEEEGGFITGIDGVSPKEDEQLFWALFINGDLADVGAADLELTPGDQVLLDLQGWE